MTARKKKLKRRSDARSERKQPETVVFFLDRAIGKRFVAEALSNRTISFPKFTFEIKVELLDNYFQHDTPDEKWLRFVGEKGWIVLTKDKRIRYRTVELEMVKKYKVQMFTLSSGNLTGEEMANLITRSLTKILRYINNNKPPFIVRITSARSLLPVKLTPKSE